MGAYLDVEQMREEAFKKCRVQIMNLNWGAERGCFKCPLFISKKKDYRCRKNNQSSSIIQAKTDNKPCETEKIEYIC